MQEVLSHVSAVGSFEVKDAVDWHWTPYQATRDLKVPGSYDVSQMQTAQHLVNLRPGSRRANFTRVGVTKSEVVEGTPVKAQVTDRFSSTPVDYIHQAAYHMEFQVPSVLAHYSGLPTVITLTYSFHSKNPKSSRSLVTLSLDVSKVLLDSVLSYSAVRYGPDGLITTALVRAVGYLKPDLGTVTLEFSYEDSYAADGKNTLDSYHFVDLDFYGTRLLRGLWTGAEAQASEEELCHYSSLCGEPDLDLSWLFVCVEN